MRRPTSSSRAGFTIVELLAVLAIIVILAAITIPIVRRVRDQANTVKCAANMRQIYQATLGFVADNKGLLFVAPSIGSTSMTRPFSWRMQSLGVCDYSTGVLWPYISSAVPSRQAIINCPADTEEYPNNYPGLTRNFSYSFNAGLNWNGIPLYDYSASPSTPQFAFRRIVSASHKILIWEEVGPNDGLCCCLGGDRDDYPSQRHMIYGKKVSDNGANTSINGGGFGNQCFADGHVEMLPPVLIWSNTYYGDLRVDH